MKTNNLPNLWAVVLAAGRGSRMNATSKNKVAYEVQGIPMITRTISVLKNAGIENIIVVVGFAKESVLALLGKDIHTAEQKEQLGTGDAVRAALSTIPENAHHVLVLNGDDSFLFSTDLFEELCQLHMQNDNAITFLSLDMPDPTGLGRVVRDEQGKVMKIVEEKDASDTIKKICEINAACYIFNAKFLRESIPNLPKSSVTGEYYIVSLVDFASKKGAKIDVLHVKDYAWRGVNTVEELEEAEQLVDN